MLLFGRAIHALVTRFGKPYPTIEGRLDTWKCRSCRSLSPYMPEYRIEGRCFIGFCHCHDLNIDRDPLQAVLQGPCGYFRARAWWRKPAREPKFAASGLGDLYQATTSLAAISRELRNWHLLRWKFK